MDQRSKHLPDWRYSPVSPPLSLSQVKVTCLSLSQSGNGDLSVSQSGDGDLSVSQSGDGDLSVSQSGDLSVSQSGDGDLSVSQSGDPSLSQSGDLDPSLSQVTGLSLSQVTRLSLSQVTCLSLSGDLDQSLSQVTVTRLSLSQVTVTCLSLSQVTVTRLSLSQVKVTRLSLSQVARLSLSQVKVTCLSLSQVTVTRLSLSQVTVTCLSLSQVTVTCLSLSQVTVTCLSLSQVARLSLSQVKVTCLSLSQVTVTRLSLSQVKVTRLSLSQVARLSLSQVKVTCLSLSQVTVTRLSLSQVWRPLSGWRNVRLEECFWTNRMLSLCRLRLLRDSSDTWTVSWCPSRDRSVYLAPHLSRSLLTCHTFSSSVCLFGFQIQTIKQTNSALKDKISSGVDEFRQPEVTIATCCFLSDVRPANQIMNLGGQRLRMWFQFCVFLFRWIRSWTVVGRQRSSCSLYKVTPGPPEWHIQSSVISQWHHLSSTPMQPSGSTEETSRLSQMWLVTSRWFRWRTSWWTTDGGLTWTRFFRSGRQNMAWRGKMEKKEETEETREMEETAEERRRRWRCAPLRRRRLLPRIQRRWRAIIYGNYKSHNPLSLPLFYLCVSEVSSMCLYCPAGLVLSSRPPQAPGVLRPSDPTPLSWCHHFSLLTCYWSGLNCHLILMLSLDQSVCACVCSHVGWCHSGIVILFYDFRIFILEETIKPKLINKHVWLLLFMLRR